MMATARGIKNLDNRSHWNGKATHERIGRPKDMEEHNQRGAVKTKQALRTFTELGT
jgi:hypothetical protein